MCRIVGHASCEVYNVVTGGFVLIDTAGVYAFALYPFESFPEVAVPGLATHLAVGENGEAFGYLAVDEAVYHFVFCMGKLLGSDFTALFEFDGFLKLLGREKASHDTYAG